MFFEDIRSERRLMEVAADRLSLRWFLDVCCADLRPTAPLSAPAACRGGG
ncbi:MAG: transposase [Actinomycetota bacterium]|nr:transposase [Actinomycetota bacterium]